MSRLNYLLLIQILIATPAFSATIIQEAGQPQMAMVPGLLAPIKIAEPKSRPQTGTAKPVKPSTVRTTAYSSVAYYQRQAQRRRELQTQRPHHSTHSAKPIQNQKQEATPLTGRIVHQEETRLQTTMLPPVMAPNLVPPVAEEVTQTGQNQARPTDITNQQKTEYRLGAWLKQLACQVKATSTKEHSWVSGITDVQSAQLARAISAYVAELLPSNSTFLLLAPPPKAQKYNPLTLALNDTLRQAGFRLVESKSQAPNAQVLLYQASQLS
jgi:hypothetical protein